MEMITIKFGSVMIFRSSQTVSENLVKRQGQEVLVGNKNTDGGILMFPVTFPDGYSTMAYPSELHPIIEIPKGLPEEWDRQNRIKAKVTPFLDQYQRGIITAEDLHDQLTIAINLTYLEEVH
jgi:hypothetical protein